MDAKNIVRLWFEKWEQADIQHLPIAEDFIHTSPYGTITGKAQYLELVEANLDKFLGHRFEIHDEIYQADKGCVRYTATKEDFILEVRRVALYRAKSHSENCCLLQYQRGDSRRTKVVRTLIRVTPTLIKPETYC